MLLGGCARTAACTEAGDGCEDAETGDTGDTGDTGGLVLPIPVSHDVDILFVIDNSGSMGDEQALLAETARSLIEVLEADAVNANYRIGVTTTDNGNPWCSPDPAAAEAGRLVMSSCKDRLDDFVFNGMIDVRDVACNNICDLDGAELEILPTTTDFDAEPKPRPWLERIANKKNIPETTDSAAAFACFAPQGINGCGFESPLESMYLALQRATDPAQDSYGFVRPTSIFAVLFLTDEADCSYNEGYASIFAADGGQVFWSDPTASFPTSAVCWNAGVECVGDPSNYDSCDAVNKGVAGDVGVSEAQAVLHPVRRYIDQLQDLEDSRKAFRIDNELIVGLIGGVGNDGLPYYADVSLTDPNFQDAYGIGPGCQSPNPLDPNLPNQAVPPVRLREVSEAFTDENMFSVCSDDYSSAFMAIISRIEDQLVPACYYQCVRDTNPDTEIIEPACTFEEDPPGNNNTMEMPECLRDADGYVIDDESHDYAMPNADVNACFAMLVDVGGQSADPNDDISDYCLDQNYNLEFKVARRPGFPAIGGTSHSAVCQLAEFPEIACPGIGG